MPVDPVAGTGFSGWSAATPAEQGIGVAGAGLERFDALWYLSIARDGYPVGGSGEAPEAAAFFPAFPALTAVTAAVPGVGPLLAGSLVAAVAAVVAVAGIFRLTEEYGRDPAAAPRAQTVLLLFPTAYILVAPYGEALFLAASSWSLIFARRRRWLPAGATAIVAALTRNVGILLAVPLFVEVARSGAPRRRQLQGLGAVAAAPLGTAVFAGFTWWRWGDPLAWISVQSGWQRELTWPWVTLWRSAGLAAGPFGDGTWYHSLDALIVGPVLAAVTWLLWRRHHTLGLYALGHVLIWLSMTVPPRPLLSVPRLALSVAPIFVAFGVWLDHRAPRYVWYAGSTVLLVVHAALFIGWYFVF